jgi:hypothetical protein
MVFSIKMGVSSATIDSRDYTQIEIIKKERNQNHDITLKILDLVGRSPEFKEFYKSEYKGVKRTPCDTQFSYEGDTESDFNDDNMLIAKINSCVIGYRKEGDSYFSNHRVLGSVKEKIKELFPKPA